MKTKIKVISVLLILIQLITIFTNIYAVSAKIKEGDDLTLYGDHECDSLVEYWMTKEGRWSYKIVWYVYYKDENNEKYPAFCVEPAKQGVGTGYDSYNTNISKETDSGIWRILYKGYMGSKWYDWDLECDDDFYSATKIALHSYKEGIPPKDKYILGNRSVDGNTVEEIQRRGAKTLEVAQSLYNYGINGKEEYEMPKVELEKVGGYKIEVIDDIEYYIQNYKVNSNKFLKSYNVKLDNFVKDTKVLNSKNEEVSNFNQNSFKIAIPIKNINDKFEGKVSILDAEVKTYPIFYAKSSISNAQSYVTYSFLYEKTQTSGMINVDPFNCSLTIKKEDSKTKKALANVTFQIIDENNNVLCENKTDENGIIKVNNLRPQVLILKEIKTLDNYVLDSEEKQINLAWNQNLEVKIENNKKQGSLTIVKEDAQNNKIKLQGVEFEIYDEEQNLIAILFTNENGQARVDNLDIGKYIIKEIKTADEYILDSEEKEVNIEYDKNTIINIKNEKDPIIDPIIEQEKQESTTLPRTGF